MSSVDPNWQAALGQLIEERIGVRLRLSEPWEALLPFVEGRISALNLPSPQSYLRYLRTEPANGAEFVRLVAVCTNGQTSFLRDGTQLRGLCDCAVALWQKRKRPLHVWSAGCSTGEEPYSLAMLFAEAKIQASILATDINVDVVQNAKQGVFGKRSLRNVSEDMRKRHFTVEGETFTVRTPLLQMVTVKTHNLLEEPPQPVGASRWDIILCRNVFIYHAPSTVEAVVTNMGHVLAPDGWLFIGASESLHRLRVPFAPAIVGTRHAYQLQWNADTLQPASDTQREVTTPTHAADEKATAPTPPPPSDNFSDSLGALKAGRFADALERVQAFLNEHPNHAPGWLLLGHLRVNAHDFSEALDAYQRAQEDAPLLAEAHYFQGVVHRKMGELPLAEQSFRRALFLSPHFWPASFMLAGIYERQNRPSLQRKELMFTLQAIEEDHTPLVWSVPVDTCKSLHMDAESVRRTCKNLLKAQVF